MALQGRTGNGGSAKWRRVEIEPVASSSAVTLDDLSTTVTSVVSTTYSTTYTTTTATAYETTTFTVVEGGPVVVLPTNGSSISTIPYAASSGSVTVPTIGGGPVASSAGTDLSITGTTTGTFTIVLGGSTPYTTRTGLTPSTTGNPQAPARPSSAGSSIATGTGVASNTGDNASSTGTSTGVGIPSSPASGGASNTSAANPTGSLSSAGASGTTPANPVGGNTGSPTVSDPTNTISFVLGPPGTTNSNGVVVPTITGSNPAFSTGSTLSSASGNRTRTIAGATVGAVCALILGTLLAIAYYRRRNRGPRLSKAWISPPLLQGTSDYPDDAYSPAAKRRPRRGSTAEPDMAQVEPRRLSEGFLGRPVSFHFRDAEAAAPSNTAEPDSHLDIDSWSTPSEPALAQTRDIDAAVAPWLHASPVSTPGSPRSDSPTMPVFAHPPPDSPLIPSFAPPGLTPTAPLRIGAKGFMRRIRGRPSISRGILTTLSPVPESPTPAASSAVATPATRTLDLLDGDDLDEVFSSSSSSGRRQGTARDQDTATIWSVSSASHSARPLSSLTGNMPAANAGPVPVAPQIQAKNFSMPWIHRSKGSITSVTSSS
uniref:Transmembrane protein n=1 Tax=Mycena chlorophos TaxID=658473 RepID=A0ABQ0KVP9_MYCCL|nr:predicted protein [Mycena chlorophos]